MGDTNLLYQRLEERKELPLDEWHDTRWGPAFPPWTKYQTNRARGWLLVMLALTAIMVASGWIAASQNPPPLGPTPRPTPSVVELTSSDEYYTLALQEALEERPDAQLCSLRLYREIERGRLTYTGWFAFCSPSEMNWRLGARVWQGHSLFGSRVRMKTYPYPNWRSLNTLEYPSVDSIEAIEAMQRAGGAGMYDYLEEWPEHLELGHLSGGALVWVGDFSYRTPGSLRVEMVVDAETGQVIEVRGYALTLP
jgi:hypothetical protein